MLGPVACSLLAAAVAAVPVTAAALMLWTVCWRLDVVSGLPDASWLLVALPLIGSAYGCEGHNWGKTSRWYRRVHELK